MNKPISKHALRRAVETVEKEGFIQYSEPVGTVVDRIWHEIEKKTFNGAKKRSAPRPTLRPLVEPPEIDVP